MSERYLTVNVGPRRDYVARLFDKKGGIPLAYTYTSTVWGAKWWARRWKPKPQLGDRVWEGEV